MGLNDKNRDVETKATFSVTKGVLYSKTGNPTLEKLKEPTVRHPASSIPERISDFDSVAIRKIEERLKLTFLSKKNEESFVCMANSPEVRDAFKDIFDNKDLLDYIYAVLHSPSNLERYKDLSNIDFLDVPYPKDPDCFWKLIDLGGKLRHLHLSELSSDEKPDNEIDKILKKINKIETE